MPPSCWGTYARVGVVELTADWPEGVEPKMLSKRSRGVLRVVETWEKLYVGKTERCARNVALAEAKALCVRLNSVLDRIVMAMD